MEINCPNCGHCLAKLDVKPLAEIKVQRGPEMLDFAGPLREAINSASPQPKAGIKGNEADAAQGLGDDTLTTVDKVKIQELRKEGYALARIQQMIGKNVSLGQIIAATKLDKKRK